VRDPDRNIWEVIIVSNCPDHCFCIVDKSCPPPFGSIPSEYWPDYFLCSDTPLTTTPAPCAPDYSCHGPCLLKCDRREGGELIWRVDYEACFSHPSHIGTCGCCDQFGNNCEGTRCTHLGSLLWGVCVPECVARNSGGCGPVHCAGGTRCHWYLCKYVCVCESWGDCEWSLSVECPAYEYCRCPWPPFPCTHDIAGFEYEPECVSDELTTTTTTPPCSSFICDIECDYDLRSRTWRIITHSACPSSCLCTIDWACPQVGEGGEGFGWRGVGPCREP
jgi:hypothetical protein